MRFLRTRGLAGAMILSPGALLFVLSALPLTIYLEELTTVPTALYRLNIEMLNPSYTSRLRVMGRATHLYDASVSRPQAMELASAFPLEGTRSKSTRRAQLSTKESLTLPRM